ncbi:hypothetical protein CVT26_000259 [Gymnopilus dilepis]|uniref:Macro domain-containing protein n=1 Tax=Gymnopilus dilepis TaxID=231916 RepID=A0A409VGB2_9AGAR|nr:hypothetical protein CVT26_000259 [Gymnopilus dilepis]
MSTDQSPSRSPSPDDVTSDTEADESFVVHLKDVKTVAELYESGVLKPASPTKFVFQAQQDLLDRVALWQGDITKLEVDAIVNAANRSLLGGGGVDGAIHSAAGPKLLDECNYVTFSFGSSVLNGPILLTGRELNGCSTGDAKITRGYRLPARHIIHAVGPIYSSKDQEEKAEQLASCYKRSLEIAVENRLKHVAFPSISTGVYSYPITAATRIALRTVREFLESGEGDEVSVGTLVLVYSNFQQLDRVIFVVWSNKDKEVYQTLIPEYFPEEEEEEEEAEEAEPADSTGSS